LNTAKSNKLLKAGELAAQAGVGVQTLHYYERLGLLPKPARSPANYRLYSPEALRRVQFIKKAQAVGFTLEEIKQIFTFQRPGAVRCRGVAELGEKRLRELGMEVGAHTVSHPILARMAPDAAAAEIRNSKRHLEDIVGAPIRLFAYPNGVPQQDYTAAHVRMVLDCGFAAAVSTAWGAASRRSDRFQLPRFTPWDGTAPRFGVRMALNLLRRAQTV